MFLRLLPLIAAACLSLLSLPSVGLADTGEGTPEVDTGEVDSGYVFDTGDGGQVDEDLDAEIKEAEPEIQVEPSEPQVDAALPGEQDGAAALDTSNESSTKISGARVIAEASATAVAGFGTGVAAGCFVGSRLHPIAMMLGSGCLPVTLVGGSVTVGLAALTAHDMNRWFDEHYGVSALGYVEAQWVKVDGYLGYENGQ